MSGNRYQRIEGARKILGLGEEATMEEIQDAFRELARKYHPDRSSAGESEASAEEFRRLIQARAIIVDYCEHYRYAFREEDILRQTSGWNSDDHQDRFYGNSVI